MNIVNILKANDSVKLAVLSQIIAYLGNSQVHISFLGTQRRLQNENTPQGYNKLNMVSICCLLSYILQQ